MDCVGDVYVNEYLAETQEIAAQIDQQAIEALVALLARQRDNDWRVFVLGLGGSLANASHLAADLRQRAGCWAEAPESLPELTALINDRSWESVFTAWLASRAINGDDLVLVLSVGGGDYPEGTSVPLKNALIYAQTRGVPTAGIVGEPGGACAELADVVVEIPTVNPERKTEHVEGWQVVLHHLIVSHPRLRRA